jgi:hypothetical protein
MRRKVTPSSSTIAVSCSARRSPKLVGVVGACDPEGSKTEVSGTSSSSVMAIRRETLGCITPRSICDTALGEMPSRRARSRADMPRATRRARSRSPTPSPALSARSASSSGGSTAGARLMSRSYRARMPSGRRPDRASRVRHM